MKLRTVIYELPCSDFVAHPESILDRDVAVAPAQGSPIGDERILRLCTEEEFEGAGDAPGTGEILLVWCGPEIPDRMRHCPLDVVAVASGTPYERFRQLFFSMPDTFLHMSVERERLFSAFMGSYDIEQFTAKAAQIIGNPVIVTNSDRRLLASAGDFPKDRADVLDEINQGYISEEVNSAMEADGVIEGVRHAHHSVLSENPKFGQRWVTSIIRYRHLEMGRFDVLESQREIRGADLELIDFAGSLAGIMIDRLGLAGDKAGSGSSVLSDLLDRTFANEKTMRTQLALTSVPLDEDYVLVSVEGDSGLSTEYHARVARGIQRHLDKCIWCARGDMVVLLVAIGSQEGAGFDGYERAARTLRSSRGLFGYLANNGLSACVSEPFSQLMLAAGRLTQCEALRDVPDEGQGPVRYFWQWRYAAIAASAKTFAQVDMMVDKRVLEMARYDHEHSTAYLETSVMSVRYPGSPADAARELNVHRNTYFYRMNKVRELFYLDLKEGEDRLAVAFSARVMRYLGDSLYFSGSTQDIQDGAS